MPYVSQTEVGISIAALENVSYVEARNRLGSIANYSSLSPPSPLFFPPSFPDIT